MEELKELNEKISSLLMWVENFNDEYFTYFDNGYGRDFDAILTALNLIERRAKQVSEYIEENIISNQ
jgi:F0F1-type ATP synthase alpha subunit